MASEEIILSGAAELMIDYEKKADSIRAKYPTCVVVRGLQEFQTYLTDYRLCAQDLLEIFPWSKNSFYRTARDVLPFIFVNKKVREVFPEELEHLSVYGKRANKLYSVRDLAAYFRTHLKSSLQTVVLPASLFVSNIEAFRRDFMEEKRKWLMEKTSKKRVIPITNHWESIAKHVNESALAEILQWENDLEDLRLKQQKCSVNRVTFPDLPVHMPEKILPYFLSPKDVAARNSCASATSGMAIIQRRGWVKHELPTPYGALFGYTPGPLIGSRSHWDDYRLGATVIMLAKRAEAQVGSKLLCEAKHWNIPKELMFKQWNTFNANPYQPLTDMEFLSPLKQD